MTARPYAEDAPLAGTPCARYFTHAVIGVVAFVATALCLHALLPFPEITGVSSKLRFYDAHKDQFDTVFIGTSRVYHQISPEIFDRTMAASGMPARSFNLGVSGMHPPESFLVLERFLALRPTKLKWVLIEFEEVQASWSVERRGTHRLLYWHNWHLTSMAIRKTINPTGTEALHKTALRFLHSLDTVGLHLHLFAQNLGNVGAAADVTDAVAIARHPNFVAYELGKRHDGYRPAGDPITADKVQEYRTSLAQAMKETTPQAIDPYAEEEYRKAARRIRAFGAIPVFVIPPTLPQIPLRFRESPEPPGAIMRFNDVGAYPAFYEPAVRFDKGHLSRAGAELYSEKLAQRFAAEVRAAKIR